MFKIYADKKYQKHLVRLIRKYYQEQEPTIECVPNGIIANEHVNGYGVFDYKYNFVKSSIQNHRGRKGQFVPKINHDKIPFVDCDAIFLCHCGKNNFGHFLVEYINRSWCFLDKKYQKMKVVIVNEIGCDKINDYIFILLGLLGVKRENIVLLNETTQFKNVYVPRPSFDITAYYTKKFADMYNKIADSVDDDIKHEKIYLSRCKLPMKRHTYGEEKIQNVFKKNGFKIIYPETLPLEKQIALMKNCRVLAGCAGTALHLALFMKKGGTVIQIKRNTVLQDNADTQYVINTAKGLNSVFIWASVEKIKTNHFSDVAQIIGPTKYMKQFFDDNNFEYNEKDLSIDDKTWQEYTNALGDMSNEKRFINMLKKYFVHYTSCLIPGRMMRKKYRHFMNEKL